MKLSLFDRVKLTLSIWRNGTYKPVVMSNGVEVDLMNQKVVFPGNYHIHAMGDLHLSSEKHILLTSGQVPEERPGYLYSIWLNSQLDDQGRPLKENQPMILDVKITEPEDHDGVAVVETKHDNKH